MKLIFGIALPLYALDQITKWWVFTHFALVPSEQNLRLFPDVISRTANLPELSDVIPGFFQLVHWANTGAAFSVGTGNNFFFIALSFATLAGLFAFFVRGKLSCVCVPSRIGIGLLVAGILGNLTDRIAHGYVVDFLLFDLHVRFANPWPAFNVADSCICVAVTIFLVRSFFEKSPG